MIKQLDLFTEEKQQDPYLHITGDIPIDIPEGCFISVERKTPLKIHSLGFQPGKSIPEIPRWFLHKYAKKNFIILEPFAGSGTTIIESIINNNSIYWLDYHPLSRLICQVKTTKFVISEVLETGLTIIEQSLIEQKSPETIYFANKDFWFQKSVQEGLEILRKYILLAKNHIQPVLWLAFSLTVRKVSDMNDGMILAAKRSKFQEIPKRTKADVFEYFKFYIHKALEAIYEWNKFLNNSTINIQELPLKDARKLSGNWQCDGIITSPPYINAIDYVWATKFELHWLGMLKNDQERLNLYAQEIGTERISKNEYQQLGKLGHYELDQLIDDIYFARKYQASKGQNQLRSRVVYQYFMDMKQHFISSFNKLNKGGYYCFTIGDISKICGIEIPVAKILTDLAGEIGFMPKFHFHLLLKNRRLNLPRNVQWAGTIKHDTIVILEKP